MCGCALTEETSYGFDVIWFAEHVLGTPLDPWECYAAVHLGELLPDGRPRFRKLLIIVARQAGKTLLCRVLTLYWQFVERWPMILSTSTNLSYAKESWLAVVSQAESIEDLAREIPKDGVRRAAGEECLTTIYGARYRIAASNRKGGRSLSIDRLVLDELREHADWSAWGAAYNAMSARPFGQCVAITNMGDATGVVLDSLRADAVRFIETGTGDPRLGLLEWSCEPDDDPEDPAALAKANPNLGVRPLLEDLLADARRAKNNGGEELTTFKTEIMCVRVDLLDPAIDPNRWEDCTTEAPLDLAEYRQSLAACVDLSLDGKHATLMAAAVIAGRVHLETIAVWSGEDCTKRLRAELAGKVRKVNPRVLGWLPGGPAAALAADLADRRKKGQRAAWPPQGVAVAEIKGELAAVCMGFASLVWDREVVHPDDELQKAHVRGAQKLRQGDRFVYARRGSGPIDGAYAMAGAAFLAKTLPPSLGKPRIVRASK